MNWVLIRPILKRTPYKLYKCITYIFLCKNIILNNEKDNLEKFDAKASKNIFIRYSTSNKAFRAF